MRRSALAVLTLILLCAPVFAWEPTKVDQNPVFSADGRFLAFERWYGGQWFGDIVVLDLRWRRSVPVVGWVTGLAWKDPNTFAITDSVHA